MTTVNEEIYNQMFNLQSPDLALFLEQGRLYFEEHPNNFYLSPLDLMIRGDRAPYNEPRMLADGYEELGLWIPSTDEQEPHRGVLLAWADDVYPTPETVQYAYLAPTGNFILGRERLPYSHLMNRTLEDIINEFIY